MRGLGSGGPPHSAMAAGTGCGKTARHGLAQGQRCGPFGSRVAVLPTSAALDWPRGTAGTPGLAQGDLASPSGLHPGPPPRASPPGLHPGPPPRACASLAVCGGEAAPGNGSPAPVEQGQEPWPAGSRGPRGLVMWRWPWARVRGTSDPACPSQGRLSGSWLPRPGSLSGAGARGPCGPRAQCALLQRPLRLRRQAGGCGLGQDAVPACRARHVRTAVFIHHPAFEKV